MRGNITTIIIHIEPSPARAQSFSASWRTDHRPPPLRDLLIPPEGWELSGRSSRQPFELYCILLGEGEDIK